ncbi:MAG TPA: alpha/beta fold hydrolase, partial [Candidatus Nanopelagicales bacterium]|nr:alpha/beta fold hydrolase [Candidatus Nanopelagicales bacterium]
ADESAAAGHHVSAREAYLRAATYHWTGAQPMLDPERLTELRAARSRAAELTGKVASLSDTPFEVVEIPFGQHSLPGYFVPADGMAGQRRPTVVYTNGYDSSAEEMYANHAAAATSRGYHILLVDGPGQGRPLARDGLTIRPDWENVVGPVLDWVLARPDVDTGRVVLAGWSLGGFLAPRAAAFESQRIAALVADPGQWDQRPGIVTLLPLSEEQKAAFPDIDPQALDPMVQWLNSPAADPGLRWKLLQRAPAVHGRSSLLECLAELSRFEISSVAANITCPTLLTAAEGDPVAAGAQKLYDAIGSKRKTLLRFTDAEGSGGHCEGTARRLYHQRVYDWLDDTLAVAR